MGSDGPRASVMLGAYGSCVAGALLAWGGAGAWCGAWACNLQINNSCGMGVSKTVSKPVLLARAGACSSINLTQFETSWSAHPLVITELLTRFRQLDDDLCREAARTVLVEASLCHAVDRTIAPKTLAHKAFASTGRHFSWFPRTFQLPTELPALQRERVVRPSARWLLKLPGHSRGTGLRPVSIEDVEDGVPHLRRSRPLVQVPARRSHCRLMPAHPHRCPPPARSPSPLPSAASAGVHPFPAHNRLIQVPLPILRRAAARRAT